MDMGEVLTFGVGVGFVVLLTAPAIFMVFNGLIDKELSTIEAVAIFGLIVAMDYAAVIHLFNASFVRYAMYLGVIYGPWLMMAVLSHLGQAHLERRFVTEDESKYWASLQRDPNNAGAHEFLGKLYKGRGLFDSAIHHLSEALRLMPDQPGVRWHLNDAIAEREKQQRPPGAVVQCLHCRQSVTPGPFCPQCGHPMGTGAQSPFLDFVEWIEQHGRPYIWGTGVAAIVFVAIDFAFPRSPIPSTLVLLTVGGGVGVLYLAWNAQRKREQGPD